MVQPVPLPAPPPEAEAVAVAIDPLEEEFSKELRENLLNGFLPDYSPRQATTGNVDQIKYFKINTSRPIPELDTATAKAYEAVDTMHSENVIYALVCENHLPVRQELAKLLMLQEESPLIKLLAEGVVRFTSLNVERYTLIYERPMGKTLYEIVHAQPQAFSDRYVREKVVTPLNHALSIFKKIGYSHGKVNPHNIYIHEGKLTLGECCSEPCSYRQDFHYEPISQIQTHPAAKGAGGGHVDYYALGVIVALMKLKTPVLEAKSQGAFTRRLLQEGSYIGVVGYVDLSDEMNDILRGTLNDNISDRWKADQVTQWCKGKRYNLLTPNIPSLGGRPFEFEDQGYQNLRQLANAMYKAWEKCIPILQDTSLARWVEQSTRRREISEYLNRVVKSYRSLTDQTAGEMITRCLFALDRWAPIRLQSVSLQPDGANVLYAELHHQKSEKLLGELKDAISQSIFASWQEAQRSNFGVIKLETALQQSIWALDRARLNIRNVRHGFGVERVLYELNPTLPCQSPILSGYCVNTITELMTALDHISTKKDRPDMPIDRHISGFIGAKLPLNNALVFDEYEFYPDLAKHSGLTALKFFQKAQVKTKGLRFPGLAAWTVASFTDAIGVFNSKTVRKELSVQLLGMAQEGDLGTILTYITTFDYSTADAKGFMAASAQYADFSARKLALQDQQMLEFRAFRLGNTVAKFIAYAIFIGICVYFFNIE